MITKGIGLGVGNFFSFKRIDSTSNKAHQLISDGQQFPFAVHALEQTHGRGRTGKTWLSPKGGLYVTMVLSSELKCSKSLASLWAGALLARFFEEQFDLKARLKWPNDLLFGGQKLAGLLVETSIQGTVSGPVVLGIGININDKNFLPETAASLGFSYRPFFLENKVPRVRSWGDEELENMARDLWEFFQQNWLDHTDNSSVLALVNQYQFGPGTLWIKDQAEVDRYWAEKRLSEDGSLVLEKLGEKDCIETLSSATHSFQLAITQEKFPYFFLLIDQGNTRTKFAIYSNKTELKQLLATDNSDLNLLSLEHLVALIEKEIRAIIGENAEISLPKLLVTYMASVNMDGSKVLRKLFKDLGLALYEVPKIPVFYKRDKYNFSQLGIDRFLAIEGVLAISKHQSRHKKNALHVIVSFGSALTVDIVNFDGKHLGGYITLGIKMQAKALHEFTSLLPEILLSPLENNVSSMKQDILLGNSTENAIKFGIVTMMQLFIEGIIKNFEKKSEVLVWISGGDKELIEINNAKKNLDYIYLGILNIIFNGYGK